MTTHLTIKFRFSLVLPSASPLAIPLRCLHQYGQILIIFSGFQPTPKGNNGRRREGEERGSADNRTTPELAESRRLRSRLHPLALLLRVLLLRRHAVSLPASLGNIVCAQGQGNIHGCCFEISNFWRCQIFPPNTGYPLIVSHPGWLIIFLFYFLIFNSQFV